MRRNKIAVSALLTALLVMGSAGSIFAQSNQQPSEMQAATMPKVGEMAPDFSLKYFDGNDLKEVSLTQYRGKKNVVVAFFIFAFTGG
jgi:cytochrome oxidase Cu insertion factor (SCO1/SenC/PrrC family)